MAEEYKLRADLAAIVSNAGSVAHWNTAEDRLVNAARADLARAAVADALAAGVRAGLEAAADRATQIADDAQKEGANVTACAAMVVRNTIRAVAADPDSVAAIAASAKGGE